MVIQIKKSAFAPIFQAQHCAGISYHKNVRQFRGKRVDLVINSPKISLSTTSNGVRASAKYRVFYHSRLWSDDDDLGTGAVADVNVRALVQLSTGNPGLLSPQSSLIVKSSETTRGDITVYGVTIEVENEVKDALMAFLPDVVGTSNIPLIGSVDRRIGYLGFRFLSPTVLAVGMNVGNTIKGSLAGLQTVFVRKDWGLAFSADYMLNEIHNSIRSQFDNAPPPPLGDSPVQLYNQCTIRVGNSCWNHQIAKLMRLDVSIESGAIVFSGRIKVRNTGLLIPDFNVEFTVKATVYIGANQSLQVSVGEPKVDIKEWYADVINWVLGGQIKNIARNGVRSIAQSFQGEVCSFFSSQMLSELASVGSMDRLEIIPIARTVEILPEAMIIHGDLSVADTDAPPIADFVQIPVEGDTFRWVLDAGDSWAPGGTITEYRWDFPDRTEVTQQTNARFVTEYRYRPLGVLEPPEICLTVTDNKFRSATTCGPVAPPDIQLTDIPVPGDPTNTINDWEVPFSIGALVPVMFQTTCGGVPLGDVLLRITGSGLKLEEYTSSTGRIILLLDPRDFEQPKLAAKLFATGRVLVEASKEGFKGTRHHLWMVRHKDRAILIRRSKKRIKSLEDRLNQFSKRIPPYVSSAKGKVSRRLTDILADLFAALEIKQKILLQIERGTDVSSILPFLGESFDSMGGSDQPKLIELVTSWFETRLSAISEQIKALEEEFPEEVTTKGKEKSKSTT